ncbi:MAG: tRNA (adenosine(37)-N6)-threonylcarbamoyltransferase complex ATPase subunit type 1 TsaE [Candidatus Magasanikbacteria bacterium]|uniref:tRNA threonylcarbamoyladenosine biosynthesis protein TsaE n=1 Tax=Candidatus Magasanikbacteria bacterium CG10_big_fil_rev_8_21_14_0_10_38_6 TaxID=1974647 RepID=A0A2M6P2A9_9BACT|nr:tRNA (adenosine(37)-N6)-threonylcarbamoyltransferase complex ATPase subunit type 1 TsaE [Candidatus Magasanikbacteria bacterium]PIR77689.1 MAG: tRNA (adenosine(37)-N6)-threonylcarbamoyltransferase complex ATPase subunit type 1 TsaE [Candidatus Magasanikbacteria bacterium CG10_big_fil_rev_8_21_14_0_10_38_6]
MEFISTCQEDTKKIGQTIASTLQPGDIITLTGNLGTGKTSLTKAIAKGLGIQKEITSPTFPIMNIYTVPKNPKEITQLIHIDTYRIDNEKELIEIGVEEYLEDSNTITIIEWPEKINSLLQNKKIKKVLIEHLGEQKRKITLE